MVHMYRSIPSLCSSAGLEGILTEADTPPIDVYYVYTMNVCVCVCCIVYMGIVYMPLCV